MKVVYIHARPHGHPLHNKYGKSIAIDSIYRDFRIRWHDLEVISFKRYLSWLTCAFTFPNKNKYDVFYSDGLVYFLIIMRKLRLIKKSQKLIGLIDDETLYFLLIGRYSKLSSLLIRYTINNYDGFICVGNFETELIHKLLKREIPVKTIINGVEDDRAERLRIISPNFKSKKILFIGSILSENRAYYKGLKFLLESFEKLHQEDNQLELLILGAITEPLKAKYLSYINTESAESVIFKGAVNNIEEYLKDSIFYLHCSNGESWGISIQEAMFAGVIPFVSSLTGAKQVVKDVSEDLVFEAENSDDLFFKVKRYLNMSQLEKLALSEKCRKVVSYYTYTNAITVFNKAFKELAN